jgi:hypothetical protein
LATVRQSLEVVATGPGDSAEELRRTAEQLGTTSEAVLGTHAAFVETDLRQAAKSWKSAQDAVAAQTTADVVHAAQGAQVALTAAFQHVLFITFLDEASRGRVGSSRSIDSYCSGWGLQTPSVDMLWSWLVEDPKVFDGKPLPLVLDSINRAVYRKPDKPWKRNIAAATPVWGAAGVFGVAALCFELLHLAGITSWQGRWAWKMLVLVLCVSLGAAIHLGARALNVNYDDPMKVEDAGGGLDWLSLRCLTVLHMYLPVLVVTIGLWGAGNVPKSFQQLGTALLAGYSADSAVGAALSRFQKRASGKQK